MQIVYNQKSLKHKMFDKIDQQHKERLQFFAFYKWMQRYQTVAVQGKHYIEKKQMEKKIKLLQAWHQLYVSNCKQREAVVKFQRFQYKLSTEAVFEEWHHYARRRAHLNKMKQVCTFFFLKNHLQRCMNTLKYNAYYRVQKRKAPVNYQERVKLMVFSRFKKKWHKNWACRVYRVQEAKKMKGKVLKVLSETAKNQKRLKEKYVQLLSTQESDLKRKVFDLLQDWKHLKHKAEYMQTIDPLDHFKARTIIH